MIFTGSVIKEQGQTFAIVLVKEHVVQSSHQAQDAINNFRPMFPGMPVVLAGQDSRGRFTYYGRTDIVNFLSSIRASQIPWKEYRYN